MLDNRLRAIASFVPLDANVADIGADHGYLAQYLYEVNPQRRVIAADKNKGPCEAATRTFSEAGINENIEVRQGDGLKVLKPGEVDTVCIAGMGGKLITEILFAEKQILDSLKTFVFQPQNAAMELRKWLYENDWFISKETLAEVDGRIYQIMLAEKGERKNLPNDLELLVGPILILEKPKMFNNHIDNIIEGYSRIINGISKVKNCSIEQEQKIFKLKNKIVELEELKK